MGDDASSQTPRCDPPCPPQWLTPEWLLLTLSHSQVVLFTQDRNLRYTWLHNPHLGFTAQDVLGKRDEELLPPEDAVLLTAVKQQVLDSGESVRREVRTTQNGVAGYYDLVVEPQRDRAGQIIGITCVASDITARKRAEDEHRLHAAVLGNIRNSVIVTDLSGAITYWNEGAERVFGYSAAEMLGKTPALLYPDANPSQFKTQLVAIAAGEDYRGEWQGRRKDGSVVWVDIETTVLCDADGAVTGFIGVGTDVTSRHRLEREREWLLRREQTAQTRLRRFVAIVAHDLVQPLTTVLGQVQRLQRGTLQPGTARYTAALHAVEVAAQQMSRLVADLGDTAAIGEGRFAVHPAPDDLAVIVAEAVAQQSIETRQRLIVDVAAGLTGTWDRHRLMQLLTNLIRNAAKYAPAGDIVVTGRRDGAEAILAVRDHGPGIPPEQQDDLFTIFSRGEETADIDGFGLGLHIVKAIAEAHGGRVWVESDLGRGSIFSVALPLGDEPAPAGDMPEGAVPARIP